MTHHPSPRWVSYIPGMAHYPEAHVFDDIPETWASLNDTYLRNRLAVQADPGGSVLDCECDATFISCFLERLHIGNE